MPKIWRERKKGNGLMITQNGCHLACTSHSSQTGLSRVSRRTFKLHDFALGSAEAAQKPQYTVSACAAHQVHGRKRLRMRDVS